MTHISGEPSEIAAILAGDSVARERRRDDNRRRHARESAARAAALTGTSRESVRKAKKLSAIDPGLLAQVAASQVSLDAAYRQAVGETRVPLYLKLDASTDDQLREAADEQGLSRPQLVAQLIADYLTQWRTDRNGWVQ